MSKKSNQFSPEVRERAVRLVQEHRGEYPTPVSESTVIDTAKSTDQFMTPLGRSRDKRDLGAFDVPTLGALAREGQVLLEKGLEA